MRSVELPDDNEDRRFLRWQERTQQQLGFLNNVLLVLGGGLIGFALNTGAVKVGLRANWQSTLAGIAVVLVMVSLACGLVMAANRLRALRMTSEMARVDFLRRRLREGRDVGRRVEDLIRHHEHWKAWGKFGLSEEVTSLRNAANHALTKLDQFKVGHQDLGETDGDSRGALSVELKATAGVAARKWTRAADQLTWTMLWLQLGLFGVGALSLAVSPAWDYFRR